MCNVLLYLAVGQPPPKATGTPNPNHHHPNPNTNPNPNPNPNPQDSSRSLESIASGGRLVFKAASLKFPETVRVLLGLLTSVGKEDVGLHSPRSPSRHPQRSY